MNRLSRDTTAPRRPGMKHGSTPQPRPDDPIFAADADPTLSVWRQVLRLF